MVPDAPDNAGEAGFTLVEMLVSLALCGLVALLMLHTLRATAAITGSAHRLDAQEEVHLVRVHLRKVLSQVAGRRIDGRYPPFLGLPDRLVVAVQADPDVTRGAEARLDLGVAPGGDGLDLIEANGPASPPARPELLLGRIAALQLRYFGVQRKDPVPGWAPAWTRPDAPPALVEVSVAFPPGDGRSWPSLVLPVGSWP
ncbi:MAG: prepilin-type N-terminal cleavage/methylation domain-containing protein [Actinomycetospora chiangmaiensis]|nr:prepilin-type N-terminal cleavage/methylation domain-containing protein [Actinomycetospora chiangmaiensis]